MSGTGNFWVLLVNAQEGSEPETYHFLSSDAPDHLKRRWEKEKVFQYVEEGSGAEGMHGLVNEEHDKADERAEEVMEYLTSMCTADHKLKPGRLQVDVYISLAQL